MRAGRAVEAVVAYEDAHRLDGADALVVTRLGVARRKARVAYCWARLRVVAPLVGRWRGYLLALHAEVHFRPCGEGAQRAQEEFEALAIS